VSGIDDALADIGAALAPPQGGAQAGGGGVSWSWGGAPAAASAPQSGVDAALADLSKTPEQLRAELPPVPEKQGGILRNIGAGANEAIASTLGAPVDAASWLLNRAHDIVTSPDATRNAALAQDAEAGLNPTLPQTNGTEPPAPWITHPFGGSDSIRTAMGLVGADPRDVGANTAIDRIARGTGEGVVSMIAPTAAARAVVGGMAPGVVQGVTQHLADVGLPTAAAIGAGSGAGGAGAAEVVPDQYKPLAELGGQLIAGGTVGGAAAGVQKLASLGLNAGRNLVGPFIPKVASGIAAEKLRAASSDPRAFAEALSADRAPLVPGSEPTTFQLTGDTGIGQLERAARTQNPVPFLDRAAEQNAARVGALQAAAPENANPQAVGDLFRQQLAAIDNFGQGTVQTAQQRAIQALADVGGIQPPEVYGEALRTQMEGAKAAAKQSESRLWQAIDPDGTLTINASPVALSASEIAASIPRTAAPPQGEEAAIFSAAQGMAGAPQPFPDFAALRSRLTTAIRQEVGTNGQTPAWRRMTMLRSAIDDTMAGKVAEVAQEQAQQVVAGTMSAEDTMAAQLAQDARAHYLSRDARIPSAINKIAAGGNGGFYPGSGPAGGSSGIAGTLGETGTPARRFGYAPGDQGLQGEPQPVANFGADAAARYRTAADATKARVQTFNNPVVGPALQERGGFYRIPETNVPQRFMGSQPATQAFLDAGAQRPTMQEALASDLRRAATNPDGTLNPARYQTWLRSHSDALQSFPELQQRLGNAASAQEAVDAGAATARAQTDAYRQSAARHFLNAEPRQAVTAAFNSRTPQSDFAELSRLVAGDPDAKAGLQQAIVDQMLGATQTSRPAGGTGISELNPAAFQKYLAKNRAALSAVFTPEQLASMYAVAADLRRAELSVSGSKIPGSPGTAQDIAATKSSVLGNILRRIGFAASGYYVGGLHGAIEGAVGGEAANAIRRAGIDQVNKLIEDALLNPERARALLTEYSPKTAKSVASRLRSAYGATTLATLLAAPPANNNAPAAPDATPLAKAIAGAR
jgi:hypothetical protein